MYNPISTYRIQFNKEFTFKQFIDNIEYFSLLGIGTIYASPVFEAAPGSMHGYDVVDPNFINPEIGSEAEFDEIINILKNRNIGWMQDIVPNHMAFHDNNTWLMDVLENGKLSKYADYFDIDFAHPHFGDKLMIPVLGNTMEDAIEQGEIKLAWRKQHFVFTYYDYCFPINIETLTSIVPQIHPNNKRITHNDHYEQFTSQAPLIVEAINNNTTKLKKLLNKRHYSLCHWQDTEKHLNYRRFFTVNSLICLKMENDRVFDQYHLYIKKLVHDKKFNGLRIDHIDGLMKPTQYFDKLRTLTGDDTYIVAEKILQHSEELINDWLIQGSTGYDFLATVNNLLTYNKNYYRLNKFYQNLTETIENPVELIYRKKKLILNQSMQGDLDNLFRMFENGGFVTYGIDSAITSELMKEAIGEFLLACPHYKLYSYNYPLTNEDKNVVKLMIDQAGSRMPLLIKALEILQHLFLDQKKLTNNKKKKALQFFLRCMQFTGPLMAKGVEDTTMYDYNCFIAHNEVGDATNAEGISIKEFHKAMLHRHRKTPMTMNATSTHDTKRGEDVRARLNIISEIADEWIKMVNQWIEINTTHKTQINSRDVPNANEEYLIYQTLTGIFPFNGKTDECLLTRINNYLVKALREAKTNSNWTKPNETYEKSILDFISKIIAPESDFLISFLPFHQKIAAYGINNSLTQIMLKATCPGIPDFYQGTEVWDLTLVDPDNRQSVNYKQREEMLKILIKERQDKPGKFFQNLYHNKENGQIKMWYSYLLMKERSFNPDIFISGHYIPLKTIGKYEENILVFARTDKNIWYVVIVPLYTTLLKEKTNISEIEWGNTGLILPDMAPERWIVFPEEKQIYGKDHILVSEIMKFPIASFMKGNKESNL